MLVHLIEIVDWLLSELSYISHLTWLISKSTRTTITTTTTTITGLSLAGLLFTYIIILLQFNLNEFIVTRIATPKTTKSSGLTLTGLTSLYCCCNSI
jgi:hypothetical protein